MDADLHLDKTDRLLLEKLQADSSISLSELAEVVSLSAPACWKRVNRLKQNGVITGQVYLCDPHKLGRGTLAFVFIRTSEHSDQWLEKFATAIRQIPEITGAYRLNGDVDYLLHVQVADIAGYDRFYKGLIRLVDISDVSSSFVMERLKFTTAIPCDNAP